MDSFQNKSSVCVHAYYIEKYIASRDYDLIGRYNFDKQTYQLIVSTRGSSHFLILNSIPLSVGTTTTQSSKYENKEL